MRCTRRRVLGQWALPGSASGSVGSPVPSFVILLPSHAPRPLFSNVSRGRLLWQRPLTCVALILTLGLCLLLALLALRPLSLIYGRLLSRSCRGIDSARFLLPPSHPQSPRHCSANPLSGPAAATDAPRLSSAIAAVPSASALPPLPIPSVVHFIVALRPLAADEAAEASFTLLNYLVILSAHRYQRPSSIVVHHHFPLQGRWFRLLVAELGPTLRVHQVQDRFSIFGRSVSHYAHKADVLRLEILLEQGGLYLDADVLILRSLSSLLEYRTVLGEEHIAEGSWNYLHTLLFDGWGGVAERMRGIDGLSNAVIACQPNSSFLHSWYEQYHSFNERQWDFHSCKLPLLLAASPEHADDVITLSTFAFFYPVYGSLAAFFDGDGVDLSQNFAVHFAHLQRRLGPARWDRLFGAVTSLEEAQAVHRGNNFGRILQQLLLSASS